MKTLLLNYPEIICEWNYEKNDGLSPNHFAALSNKRYIGHAKHVEELGIQQYQPEPEEADVLTVPAEKY